MVHSDYLPPHSPVSPQRFSQCRQCGGERVTIYRMSSSPSLSTCFIRVIEEALCCFISKHHNGPFQVIFFFSLKHIRMSHANKRVEAITKTDRPLCYRKTYFRMVCFNTVNKHSSSKLTPKVQLLLCHLARRLAIT